MARAAGRSLWLRVEKALAVAAVCALPHVVEKRSARVRIAITGWWDDELLRLQRLCGCGCVAARPEFIARASRCAFFTRNAYSERFYNPLKFLSELFQTMQLKSTPELLPSRHLITGNRFLCSEFLTRILFTLAISSLHLIISIN
jgi:hypothetical protein